MKVDTFEEFEFQLYIQSLWNVLNYQKCSQKLTFSYQSLKWNVKKLQFWWNATGKIVKYTFFSVSKQIEQKKFEKFLIKMPVAVDSKTYHKYNKI